MLLLCRMEPMMISAPVFICPPKWPVAFLVRSEQPIRDFQRIKCSMAGWYTVPQKGLGGSHVRIDRADQIVAVEHSQGTQRPCTTHVYGTNGSSFGRGRPEACRT